MTYQTTQAFRELIELVSGLEEKVLGLTDEPSVLEGYRWIPTILQVALDAYVWADSANPRFVDIVGPYRKWGGDNSDAFYQYAPLDPSRTYHVRGHPADAVYFSLTVYGGPNDGGYSTRIVGSRNNRQLTYEADGSFELTISPEPHDGNWLTLESDAVCAITRDYLADPVTGRRMEWHISAEDVPSTFRNDDADLARRLRAAATWIREQATIVPLPLATPNVIDAPYPVPVATYGWAAGDAAYAMGAFDLADNEALVIEGRSPDCAFWNLCLWNPFLHTYNYDYERVTINGTQVALRPDGSWSIVIAGRDPGHPNWVSTAGHQRGRIWFRWFLPSATPEQPTTKVIPLDQAGSSSTAKDSM